MRAVHIPRAAWPEIREMFMEREMRKQDIADHYGVPLSSIQSALRLMGCKLSPDEVVRRNCARMAAANIERAARAAPEVVKPAPPFSIAGVVDAASLVTGVSVDDLCSPSRFSKLVRIRAAIYYITRPYYSFPHIGRFVGGRDHSTVINGMTIAERFMAKDWRFQALVESIRNEATRKAASERRAIAAHVERLAA